MAFDSWADPHPGLITQTILTEKEGEVGRNRMPDVKVKPGVHFWGDSAILEEQVLPLGPFWLMSRWSCHEFASNSVFKPTRPTMNLGTLTRLDYLGSPPFSPFSPSANLHGRTTFVWWCSNLRCIPKTFIPEKQQKNTPPKSLQHGTWKSPLQKKGK